MSEARPHLLVVDDEQSIRDPLADYLERNGFRASRAASAKEARRLLAAYAIDLVVLDVMMPGEDGLSLARPLRWPTAAAAAYRPPPAPVPAEGPDDVRGLIESFDAMRTRIDDMLGEKDRMLGAIAHDLRPLLASLRLKAEAVADEAERARMAETIEEMDRTLGDILSFARLGRASEPATRVDLPRWSTR